MCVKSVHFNRSKMPFIKNYDLSFAICNVLPFGKFNLEVDRYFHEI